MPRDYLVKDMVRVMELQIYSICSGPTKLNFSSCKEIECCGMQSLERVAVYKILVYCVKSCTSSKTCLVMKKYFFYNI